MNHAFKDSIDGRRRPRRRPRTDTIRGIIFTSAKKTFFAGGDLKRPDRRSAPTTPSWPSTRAPRIKATLRRIETLGKPVVAAINGAALGGGYEIALACHHRIALDAPGSKIGLPEVTLGLLPAGGGVTRTVRLIGIADALLKVLLQGTQYNAAARPGERPGPRGGRHPRGDARQGPRLHRRQPRVASSPGTSRATGSRAAPPPSPKFAANLPAFPANLKKQLNGAPYPAPRNILAAAVEGSQVDFETAQTIEARYFVELVTGQIAKNMIQAFFFDLQAVNSGANRPKGIEQRKVGKVAVLGAGMMGAGIAYSCAQAGHRGRPQGRLRRGRRPRARPTRRSCCAKAVARGRTTEAEARRAAGPHHPHRRPGRTSRAATPSSRRSSRTPRSSTRSSRRSSTSSRPTRCCAPTPPPCRSPPWPRASSATGDFIGLHFFSPVDKMPLVEIIKGERTGDEALARAFDLVRQISKTPIVVNDSRGFFTSRVIGHFINEGVAMVGEGLEPGLRRAGRRPGRLPGARCCP